MICQTQYVIVHTNNCSEMLYSEANNYFLEKLQVACKKHKKHHYNGHTYKLLTNHVHLLIEFSLSKKPQQMCGRCCVAIL